LCHLAGGELEQIQFLLGRVSIQTTERYLGCKQKLRCAVKRDIGICGPSGRNLFLTTGRLSSQEASNVTPQRESNLPSLGKENTA